jgi:hypothetical protein
VTAHAPLDVPPLVDPVVEVVVGLVGDEDPQPAVVAAQTAAIVPSASRRFRYFRRLTVNS